MAIDLNFTYHEEQSTFLPFPWIKYICIYIVSISNIFKFFGGFYSKMAMVSKKTFFAMDAVRAATD